MSLCTDIRGALGQRRSCREAPSGLGPLGPGECVLGLTERAAREQVSLQGVSTRHSQDNLTRRLWAWPPSGQRIAGSRGQPAGACRSALGPAYTCCACPKLRPGLCKLPGGFPAWHSRPLRLVGQFGAPMTASRLAAPWPTLRAGC